MHTTGYGSEEARIALRSTYGELTSAVDWIIRKREEKAQNKEQEREDLKRRKLQKKLGKCANGQVVNVQLYQQLKGMGYSPFLISEALRRCDNDANAAIQLMGDETFESQVLSGVINKMATNEPSTSSSSSQNPELSSAIANITELAASLPGGAAALGGDLAGAMTALATNPDAISSAINSIKTALNSTLSEEALLSLTPTPSEEEVQKSRKAYNTLAKDIHSEAEYIDLEMRPENTYLAQYKALLESLWRSKILLKLFNRNICTPIRTNPPKNLWLKWS